MLQHSNVVNHDQLRLTTFERSQPRSFAVESISGNTIPRICTPPMTFERRWQRSHALVRSHLRLHSYQASTTDMWTVSSHCSHMGVITHWLDDNFGSHNKCLAVRPVPGSHTADFISHNSVTVIRKSIGLTNAEVSRWQLQGGWQRMLEQTSIPVITGTLHVQRVCVNASAGLGTWQ